MGKIIITLNLPKMPKAMLKMIAEPLKQTFAEEMKKNGVAPENVSVEIKE